MIRKLELSVPPSVMTNDLVLSIQRSSIKFPEGLGSRASRLVNAKEQGAWGGHAALVYLFVWLLIHIFYHIL